MNCDKRNYIYIILMLTVSAVVFSAEPTFIQSVTYNGETITMRLTRENLRGPNFELWIQNSTGGYNVITPVDERSYLGTVDEHPGAISSGSSTAAYTSIPLACSLM